MIIVEGPDGGGKTTLIQLMSEKLKVPVAPRVVSKDTEAMVDLQDWVDNNLDEGFQKVIFDRHRLISESIYGPILRAKAQPGFDRTDWLMPRLKRFYEIQPIIVYCLPPLSVVMANVSDDVDNQVVRDRIQAIYSAYVARAAFDYALSPGSVHIWNYVSSPRINGKPVWLSEIADDIKEQF